MTVTCTCVNNEKGGEKITIENQPDCTTCANKCLEQGHGSQGECIDTGKLLGLSIGVLLAFILVSIIVLFIMVWFSMRVMNKCKGKPGWLNPLIITLLVLWLLMGWFPPIGLLLFIILLVILIMYNNKCKKR
jgi:hypothetical protein